MERSKNTKGGNMNNNKKGHNFLTWIVAISLTAIAAAGCAGGPLTAREKGAGIGALGGAPIGRENRNAKSDLTSRGAIVGTLQLGSGGLIGNSMQR